MYKRILLAYDGSESGQKALLDCHDIAQWSHSELFLIAVMPLSTIYVGVEGGFYDSGHEERDQREQQKYDILEDGLQRLSSSVDDAWRGGCRRSGRRDHQIRAQDRRRPHRRRSSASGRLGCALVAGSTARSPIEHAPCSVLVVITPSALVVIH
jgi:nucleotide-binding universal stress UspA family protein